MIFSKVGNKAASRVKRHLGGLPAVEKREAEPVDDDRRGKKLCWEYWYTGTERWECPCPEHLLWNMLVLVQLVQREGLRQLRGVLLV